MNQHDWVQKCTEYYKQNDLTPEPGTEWQEAHYPAPKGMGTDVIWLRFEDHQVQGLLQSEEYGRMCFFPHDVETFLKHSPFLPGWFDMWDLCEKWFAANNSANGKKNVVIMRDHFNTGVGRVEGGKRTAERTSKPVLCIETGTTYSSVREAARETGMCNASISSSCRKGHRAGGYHWRFTSAD
jgi:hypothetical protein